MIFKVMSPSVDHNYIFDIYRFDFNFVCGMISNLGIIGCRTGEKGIYDS